MIPSQMPETGVASAGYLPFGSPPDQHSAGLPSPGDVRRQAVDRLRAYYGAIGRAADEIAEYAEKQKFLKAVYEDFYKAYNPAAADRLGVVYTPNEVVDFIIRGADHLLQKHFGRSLADDNVQILDPATGTGTFVTSLIDYLPADRLEHKYLQAQA